MKKTALRVLISLSLSLLAYAHGDLEHVLGTVVKITDQALSVKVGDGTVKVVMFDEETHFLKGNATSTVKDVVVGSRVVIHARKHGDSLHAVEVKIGTSTAVPGQHRYDL